MNSGENQQAASGFIVRAIAGRDKDGFFVILRTEGKFAFIADGKSRKIAVPKKKSLKHLKITNNAVDLCNLTDKKLRRVLGDLKKSSGTP